MENLSAVGYESAGTGGCGQVRANRLKHAFSCFFPTLTCGVFVFSSVSASRRLTPPVPSLTLTHSLIHSLTHTLTHHSLTHTHSLTHSHSHSLTQSLTHSLTHTLTHSLSLTHSHHSITHSLTHSLTQSLTHSLKHSLTHSLSLTRSLTHTLTHSLMCILWQAWDNVHCQGVGCMPWRPLVSASFAWQAWDNVHCQGVGCTPWRPLGLRLFCVAGVAQCALPRGRMYALASLGSPPLLRGRRGTMCTAKGSDVRPGVPWVSASFAWQAWDNLHCQGVGCTPWRPLGLRLFCVAGVAQCEQPRGRMYALASLGSPPLLRGRRGTMCTAKGSDVRPGVPWVSASFAWQAWDNLHCQGVGCTPWRPLGLRLFCVAGVAQCEQPRGRMYALASLGSPPLLRGRRGTMCTAKGSDVRPGVPWVPAAFAWQAWHNVHCQGVGCTPWRPSGLRLFCVAGVGQCALPRGRMYALASLGLRVFCVAGVAQSALPRGRMYALASLRSPPLLRGRRGTICTAKGSDVRPGVPWVSASFAWQAWHNVSSQGVGCTPWRPLGLRLFCVAGVGQCALPRGRMYALASLGSPPLLRGRRGTMCTAKGSDVRPGVPRVSASFAWQAWDNVHCQGVGCTPWRPSGSASFAWQAWHNVHCQGVGCTPWRPLGLRLFCVAGVAQCALPRGRMYALASLGSPPLLRGRRGTMCTAKGSDVRPGVPWVSASFAWQAWDNVHCQGVGCTPWRPLGLRLFCVAGVAQCALPRGRMYALASLGSPPLLRGRRGTMCTAKGSDVRPGVPWVSASFAWQAWDNVHCQGVGCTPWRPLGLRLFCVAGVAQCALRRGFCVAGVEHCAHTHSHSLIHFFHFHSF